MGAIPPTSTGDKMIDQINYDRSERCYKFIDPDGVIFQFPSGNAGKAEAFRFALATLEPDLYAAVENLLGEHPYLERVAWKAAELVATGKVEVYAAPQNGLMAMVDSSDEFGRYAIQSVNGGITCQCYAYQEMTAPMTPTGAIMCKHKLAAHLWKVSRALY